MKQKATMFNPVAQQVSNKQDKLQGWNNPEIFLFDGNGIEMKCDQDVTLREFKYI